MVKTEPKNIEAEAVKPSSKPAEAVKINLDTPTLKEAIQLGQATLKEGKTKADAAWAMYGKIKDEAKEVIVAAFVAGATLTPKGALTYWYNCRRKAAKQEKASAGK